MRLSEFLKDKIKAPSLPDPDQDPAPHFGSKPPAQEERAQPHHFPAHSSDKKTEPEFPSAPPTTAPEPPQARTEKVFDDQPAGLYEAARQLGIAIPPSRVTPLRKASECLSTVFDLLMSETSNKDVVWPMLKSIATDIDGIVQQDPNVVSLLYEYREDRERLLWHSLYTAVLAMHLAHHSTFLDALAQDIGGAALLHDVGLLAGKGDDGVHSDDSEDPLEHVRVGISMIKRIAPPPSVLTMISQHHRRADSELGILGGDESVFLRSSQVIACANVCEKAVFKLANPVANDAAGHMDLSGLFARYRKAYDSDLLKKMIQLLGFYPVGSMVELNNRSLCEVVRQNEGLPLRPVVRVVVDGAGNHPESERVVDLKQVRVLTVARAVAYARKSMS